MVLGGPKSAKLVSKVQPPEPWRKMCQSQAAEIAVHSAADSYSAFGLRRPWTSSPPRPRYSRWRRGLGKVMTAPGRWDKVLSSMAAIHAVRPLLSSRRQTKRMTPAFQVARCWGQPMTWCGDTREPRRLFFWSSCITYNTYIHPGRILKKTPPRELDTHIAVCTHGIASAPQTLRHRWHCHGRVKSMRRCGRRHSCGGGTHAGQHARVVRRTGTLEACSSSPCLLSALPSRAC